MSTVTHLGDPTRVRIADSRDVEDLMKMCREMHDENFVLPMDDSKVRELLVSATRPEIEQRRGVIGIIGERGQMQASIGLVFESTWYSSDLCLFDAWTFVRPDHRSSTASHDLIAWAKSIRDHFATPLMIGILSNHRTEAKVRLMRRQMGQPVGAFFMYGQQQGAH